MTTLHAQPYDISATGFYFENEADYNAKVKTARNDYGQRVEEFEIQFIDGEELDCQLFKALNIHQGNLGKFFEIAETWGDQDKVKIIIVTREAGHSFDLDKSTPDDFGIDIYELDRMTDLASQFVDEGFFGEIPKSLQNYIDLEAIARDLHMDFVETNVNGTKYIYRCD